MIVKLPLYPLVVAYGETYWLLWNLILCKQLSTNEPISPFIDTISG